MIMKIINDDQILTIQDMIPLNSFLFNRNGYFELNQPKNDEVNRLIEMNDLNKLYEYFTRYPKSKLEYNISKSQFEQKWVLLFGQPVEYNKERYILCYTYDISNVKKNNFELERAKKLRTLMLEVTQSIFIASSIKEIFDLSLNNSLKAIEKSDFGTIMLKEGDFFKPISYFGFKESISDFILPCKESFLARNTDNKMDRLVLVKQENLGAQLFDFNIDKNKSIIRTTITGPIYVEGELFGIINIDSFEENAYDEEDVQTMEFIRKNIEVAITNHKLYQEKLILSQYDNLTSLYNRHFFEEQFEIHRKRANRYNEEFYIVLFDIDHFKSINDRYGHYVGDQVLKYISSLLTNNQRDSDLLARFGGDEFIGIVFETSREKLNHKYVELRNTLSSQELNVDNSNIPCSFSFGIAQYPNDGKTLDELVKVADFEMYKNKRSNR